MIAASRREPARRLRVVSPPDALDTALRAIRAAAAALELGLASEARGALSEAARILVFLHTEVDGRSGVDDLARAYRRIAFRLKDADLLHDPRAARDAEAALVVLSNGLARSGAVRRGRS